MQPHNLLDVQLSQLCHRHPQVHRQEMCALGQSVHYDPDGVMPSKSLWQMGHKVHRDAIPFPYRYLQGLHNPTRSLMLHICLLTGQIGRHELCHILLHPLPPKSFLEVLIHLNHARMQAKTTFVPFLQDYLFHLDIIKHTHSALEPEYSITTQSKILPFI